jgi:hypothetical protein
MGQNSAQIRGGDAELSPFSPADLAMYLVTVHFRRDTKLSQLSFKETKRLQGTTLHKTLYFGKRVRKGKAVPLL